MARKANKASNRNTTTQTRTISHREAFEAMDAVTNALTDLEGTFNIFDALLDGTRLDDEDGIVITLWRHLEKDRTALREAQEKAWRVILNPRPLRTQKGGAA